MKLVNFQHWGVKKIDVCCGTVYSDGVHHRDSAQILLWNESTGSSISRYPQLMGKAVAWRRLCHVEKATLSAFLSLHTSVHYPSSLRMENDKPSQSHRNITQRWSMNFVALKLPPNLKLWLQQDSATPHITVINMAALHCFFSAAGVFLFQWCAMASLFAGPNSTWLFLWGYLKCKVYSGCPVDLNTFKQAIWDETANFSEESFKKCTASQLICSCAFRRVTATWKHCTKKVK